MGSKAYMGLHHVSAQPHILVVEDESGIRTSLAMVLEMEDFRVSCASDGRQALDKLSEEVPDLVLTDYVMPLMDGGELIRKIRQSPGLRHLPIVVMSAALPPGVDLREDVQAIVRKPFAVDHLLDLIENNLG